MCGLAGFFGKNRSKVDIERNLLNMGNVIAHRGPDDSGLWHEKNKFSIGFVHRRLSILD